MILEILYLNSDTVFSNSSDSFSFRPALHQRTGVCLGVHNNTIKYFYTRLMFIGCYISNKE